MLVEASVSTTEGKSLSSTATLAETITKPEAEAVTLLVKVPSTRPLSTAVARKVALSWLEGIITEDGTARCEALELLKATNKFCVLLPERCTMPVTLWPLETIAAEKFRLSAGKSISRTVTIALLGK